MLRWYLSPALVPLSAPPVLWAQMPFYTDDTEVTAAGTLHVEAFDELDALQSSDHTQLNLNTGILFAGR